jgi:hypothetical protein
MMKKFTALFLFFSIVFAIVLNSCKKEPVEPTIPEVPETPAPTPTEPTPLPTGVSVDLSTVPYQKLSEYRFFKGQMKDQVPEDGVIPYQLASSLFTDYALKKRFVWLPSGLKGTYIADNKIIELPVGAALIKTFYYDNVQPSGVTKILETRIMIKKSTGWIFAEYVWNEEQTEATLQMDGSNIPISWNQNGTIKKD